MKVTKAKALLNPNTIRLVLHAADNTATPLHIRVDWDCCPPSPLDSLRIVEGVRASSHQATRSEPGGEERPTIPVKARCAAAGPCCPQRAERAVWCVLRLFALVT